MTNLKAWLRRTPKPVAILADDKRIDVPLTPRCWAELEETILAIGPARLVALGHDGKTLRAVTLEADDDEKPAAAASNGNTELVQMARLLKEAYADGAAAQAKAYASIFEENTKLVRLLADRLGALEAAWQKSLQTHARMTIDLANANSRSSGDDGDDAILAPLLQAAMAGGLSKNGAAERK